MNFYKVFNEQEEFLSIASSLDLRYYNPVSGMILCCKEDLAQYIRPDGGKLYRVLWFNSEPEELKGMHPVAYLQMSNKEEYETYMKEKTEKENLV